MLRLEEEAKVADRLAYAMALRCMRQVDLVEKTKIPKASIHQYLTDYAVPKTDRLQLMADALDVNPVWLMGMKAPMERTIDIPVGDQLSVQIMHYYEKMTKLSESDRSLIENLIDSLSEKNK